MLFSILYVSAAQVHFIKKMNKLSVGVIPDVVSGISAAVKKKKKKFLPKIVWYLMYDCWNNKKGHASD